MKGATLTRHGSIPGQGTFGTLRTNGFSCVTVEKEWHDNDPDKSCIPLGAYECSIYDSPKHGKVYLLKNVPNRSMIEIHVANVQQELLGCIALGNDYAPMSTPATKGKIVLGVNQSDKTFHDFMTIMNGEDFLLSIERD